MVVQIYLFQDILEKVLVAINGNQMRQLPLLAWKSSLHYQLVKLGKTIEEHHKFQKVDLHRLLKCQRIKFLFSWLVHLFCLSTFVGSLKLVSSIFTCNSFGHALRYVLVGWGLVVHLDVGAHRLSCCIYSIWFIVILLRILMHHLLPLLQVLLHLTDLNQLAQIHELIDDFLMFGSGLRILLLQLLRSNIGKSLFYALQMLGMYRNIIIIQVWKPIQTELLQILQSVHARWNIHNQVVMKQ